MPARRLPAGSWIAPIANDPVRATVRVPGSKSETNRALVLAAVADGPSTITNGLDARDTQLMRNALRGLGVQINELEDGSWRVVPPPQFAAGASIDCGLAGTVMRFVPPLAALAAGPVTFDGDDQAYGRPMAPLLNALATLGASYEPAPYEPAPYEPTEGTPSAPDRLPFTIVGRPDLPGGRVDIDAGASSQFLSGLLLAGARYAGGLDVRHVGGAVPSEPYVQMTVTMLRERGVLVDDDELGRWRVSPGPVAARDVTIAPDLANAAPFLAAAAITGGSVTVPNWPRRTDQAGDAIRWVLSEFGAQVTQVHDSLTVAGTDEIRAVDLDLRQASELLPVAAAVAALADGTSHLRGVEHVRGHETDRLAALAANLNALGAHVRETRDGLTIHPRLLGGAAWSSYADHRIIHAGALLGLVVAGVEIDEVAGVAKTMPAFVDLWTRMLADADAASDT